MENYKAPWKEIEDLSPWNTALRAGVGRLDTGMAVLLRPTSGFAAGPSESQLGRFCFCFWWRGEGRMDRLTLCRREMWAAENSQNDLRKNHMGGAAVTTGLSSRHRVRPAQGPTDSSAGRGRVWRRTPHARATGTDKAPGGSLGPGTVWPTNGAGASGQPDAKRGGGLDPPLALSTKINLQGSKIPV